MGPGSCPEGHDETSLLQLQQMVKHGEERAPQAPSPKQIGYDCFEVQQERSSPTLCCTDGCSNRGRFFKLKRTLLTQVCMEACAAAWKEKAEKHASRRASRLAPSKRRNRRSKRGKGGKKKACSDNHQQCSAWVAAGECWKNPAYMH